MNAPDAFLVYDLSGRILDANRVACESLGYVSGELASRSLAEVDAKYDAAEFLTRHSAMVLGVPVVLQRVLRRKDGTTFLADLRTSLCAEGERLLFLAIAREIPDPRRVEEDHRQSQKMEALGRLAGGVAHDFNNLLTAILGYSDVILEQFGPGFAFRNELMEVKRAGERAAELTRQLLAFSRRQPSRPRVLELGSLVRGMEGMLRRLIPETIRVEFSIDSEDLFIHRDIKPQNIMIDRTGKPYLMDFGLAKTAEVQSSVTSVGTVMGTPGYMAPEQAIGRTSCIDRRTDVYSLGAILYHLLTGRPPFQGANPLDTIRKVIYENLTPLTDLAPGVPRTLEEITLRSLDKDKKRRHPTARHMAADLERFVSRVAR